MEVKSLCYMCYTSVRNTRMLLENQENPVVQEKAAVGLQSLPCSPWCQVLCAGKRTRAAFADPVPAKSSPLRRGAASWGLHALLLRGWCCLLSCCLNGQSPFEETGRETRALESSSSMARSRQSIRMESRE